MFDKGWYLALKEAFKGLADSDRQAIELVWNYPGVPVFHLPARIGRKPGGSVWLAIGDRIAKKRLWSRVPRRIRSQNERPGYLPFYSGVLSPNASTVQLLYASSHSALIDGPYFPKQLRYLLLIEELIRSGRRYISERRLVKQSRIHHA